MVIVAAVARAIGRALHSVADGLLWLADLLTGSAKLILVASRLCIDRAREWDPRLWDRDQDAGTDTRERQP